MTLRIFISHASQDTAFAEQLAADLRRAGADVWLDATHMGSGDFIQRINRSLKERDVLLLVMTPDAIASNWVPDEMNAAIARYKQGFMRAPAVVLAKPVPLQDIPPLWTIYNRVDATTNYNSALAAIVHTLGLALPVFKPPVVTPPVLMPAPPVKYDAPLRPTLQSSSAPMPTHTPIVTATQKVTAVPTKQMAPAAPPASAARSLSRRNLLIGAGAVGLLAAVISSAEWLTHVISVGTVRWNYQTGSASSPSVAVANGMVYFSWGDKFVYALDATTGAKRWSYQTSDAVQSTPAVANGLVYFGSDDGSVFALDANSGAKRWSYQTSDWVGCTPAVANGLVYIGGNRAVYALDATTGAKRWSYPSDPAESLGYSSPAVANGLVYFGCAGSVFALDATTGANRWGFGAPGGVAVYSPAVANGLVCIGADDGSVFALDATTSVQRWSFRTGNAVQSTPAVANGLVYVGSLDALVYALDATTGAKRWSYQTDDQVQSTPAVANGLVYVGSDDKLVYALDANSGAKRWSCQPGGAVRSLAVTDGLVCVGSTGGNVGAINT